MSAFDKIIGYNMVKGELKQLAKKRYLISDDFKRIKADCVA